MHQHCPVPVLAAWLLCTEHHSHSMGADASRRDKKRSKKSKRDKSTGGHGAAANARGSGADAGGVCPWLMQKAAVTQWMQRSVLAPRAFF